jgi:hypothetical protein
MPKLDKSAWIKQAVDHLSRSGAQGREAADFLRRKHTRITFSRQKSSAARWMPPGWILLNTHQYSPQTPPDEPFLLCTLLHEVYHLQQGWLTALSVYGELDAWQVGFRFYYGLTGKPVDARLSELLSLPLAYDRAMLRHVRTLMQGYAGKGYRIDLMPLFPLHQEISWRLGWRPQFNA